MFLQRWLLVRYGYDGMGGFVMSASINQYEELFGNVKDSVNSMARCACVACNSCTCGCSCRAVPDINIEWENI